jgi:hypothetical protein
MKILSGTSQSHRDDELIDIVQYSQHVYLKICCRISLNIAIPDSTLVEEDFIRPKCPRHHTFNYLENVIYSWKSFLFCVLCLHGTAQLHIQFA